MLRVLAVIAAFALLVYALSDFATSDERDRGGIPKWLWVILIVVLVYFGPLAWIAYSRSRRSAGATSGGRPSPGAAPRGRRRPGQPVAPDDDPDFLWRLAREQREQARRDGTSASTDGTAASSSPEDDVVEPPEGHDDGTSPRGPSA